MIISLPLALRFCVGVYGGKEPCIMGAPLTLRIGKFSVHQKLPSKRNALI